MRCTYQAEVQNRLIIIIIIINIIINIISI